MKKSFLLVAIVFGSFTVGITSCNNSNKTESGTEQQALYQCPMDCEKGKTHDKPGQCSVCGMDLEKVEAVHNSDSTHHAN